MVGLPDAPRVVADVLDDPRGGLGRVERIAVTCHSASMVSPDVGGATISVSPCPIA